MAAAPAAAAAAAASAAEGRTVFVLDTSLLSQSATPGPRELARPAWSVLVEGLVEYTRIAWDVVQPNILRAAVPWAIVLGSVGEPLLRPPGLISRSGGPSELVSSLAETDPKHDNTQRLLPGLRSALDMASWRYTSSDVDESTNKTKHVRVVCIVSRKEKANGFRVGQDDSSSSDRGSDLRAHVDALVHECNAKKQKSMDGDLIISSVELNVINVFVDSPVSEVRAAPQRITSLLKASASTAQLQCLVRHLRFLASAHFELSTLHIVNVPRGLGYGDAKAPGAPTTTELSFYFPLPRHPVWPEDSSLNISRDSLVGVKHVMKWEGFIEGRFDSLPIVSASLISPKMLQDPLTRAVMRQLSSERPIGLTRVEQGWPSPSHALIQFADTVYLVDIALRHLTLESVPDMILDGAYRTSELCSLIRKNRLTCPVNDINVVQTRVDVLSGHNISVDKGGKNMKCDMVTVRASTPSRAERATRYFPCVTNAAGADLLGLAAVGSSTYLELLAPLMKVIAKEPFTDLDLERCRKYLTTLCDSLQAPDSVALFHNMDYENKTDACTLLWIDVCSMINSYRRTSDRHRTLVKTVDNLWRPTPPKRTPVCSINEKSSSSSSRSRKRKIAFEIDDNINLRTRRKNSVIAGNSGNKGSKITFWGAEEGVGVAPADRIVGPTLIELWEKWRASSERNRPLPKIFSEV